MKKNKLILIIIFVLLIGIIGTISILRLNSKSNKPLIVSENGYINIKQYKSEITDISFSHILFIGELGEENEGVFIYNQKDQTLYYAVTNLDLQNSSRISCKLNSKDFSIIEYDLSDNIKDKLNERRLKEIAKKFFSMI